MSHGSEESEDYWPGYVDALTSMVQVLAFVMMLLAMAVFVLSQNVTKSAIKAIADAANVDASSDSSVNELTAKVVEQLQRRKEQRASEAAPAQQTAAVQPSAPEPSKTEAQPGETAKPAAAQTQSASTNAAAPASDAGAKDKPATPPAPPAPAGASDDALRVERSTSAVPKPAEPRRAPPDDAKRLQLHFNAHEFKMAEVDLKALEAFVQNQSANGNAAHVILRAYAFSDKGAVTDARRVAYYRALSVRGNLLKRGVLPANIEVSVIDTLEQAKGGIVDVVIDGKKQ